MNQNTSDKRWNIFVRELEDILATRQLRLTHLDDRASIHREKVRRLARSLTSNKSFPVLNPDEMERTIKAFGLNKLEIVRLRAALLVTAIEQMLMDRINEDDALVASEEIFPMILATMQKYSFSTSKISTIRNDDVDENQTEETEIDLALEPALEAFDRATIALHMSTVNAQTERIKYAREALAGFKMALAELDDVENIVGSTISYQTWRVDIENGLLTAEKRLEELGEEV
jgi:hypothetical protein